MLLRTSQPVQIGAVTLQLVAQIRARDFEPALEWLETHFEDSSRTAQSSRLKFRLHSLIFVQLLDRSGTPAEHGPVRIAAHTASTSAVASRQSLV